MSATTYETTEDPQSAAGPGVRSCEEMTPVSASAAMAPRVYRGRSIEELIPKIQVELGRDAIILRRRSGLTGGIAGFFQRRFVEIEARPGAPRVDLYDEAQSAPQEDREGTSTTLPRGGTTMAAARGDAPPSEAPPPSEAAPPGGGAPLRGAAPPRLATLMPAKVDPTAAPPPEYLPPQPSRARAPMTRNGTGHRPSTNGSDTFMGIEGAYAEAMPAPSEGSHADRMRTYSRRPGPASQTADAGVAPAVASEAALPHAAPPSPTAPSSAGSQTPGAHRPEAVGQQTNGQVGQQTNGHPSDALDGFSELTPESLLSPSPQRNGAAPSSEPPRAAPPSQPLSGGSFAAALAEAEEAFPSAGVEERLLELGVGEQLVGELVEIAARETLGLLSPQASLADAVRLVLRVRIPRCAPLPTASAMIALVGPGGSGKTAVCRALVENHRRHETRPVACATIVTRERQGGHAMLLAPDVLEPTPIADPHAASALRGARANGLLLLDMPPVSPGDRGSVYDLAALLDALGPDRVVLALPATLGTKPAAQLLQAMRPLGASALAITHADETDQLGVAVHAACAFGLAPEYLLDYSHADGLLQIDPSYLADRLLA